MWPQIKDDLFAGQGMGSRFVSNVIISGSSLASAPHVGILTFLMKGGIPLFFFYAVLPLFGSVYFLLRAGLPEQQRGAAAASLMFIVSASLSGGWTAPALFAYGLALASMLPKRIRVTYSGVQYGSVHWTSEAPSPAPRFSQR
jgi:O-antigen ligase